MANINRSGSRTPAAAMPESPFPAACPPPRRVAPPRTPSPPRPRSRRRAGDEEDERHFDHTLRDELVAAREERSPEGLSVTRTAWFYSLLFAGLFAAVMIGAIVLALARSFGWAAVAVGVLLLLAYIVVGGGPEWIAGRMRARERRQIEDEVTIDLRGFDRPPHDAPE
jgi:hypothetical protein